MSRSRWYLRVASRAGHRCEYCLAPEAIFNLPFEVEHIVPTSRGGLDDEANLGLACRSCNLFKSDQTTFPDELTGETVPLFRPRRNRWDDHFRLEPEQGLLVGITSTDRATIACLRMNRDVQREARRAWCRLGLYP